MKLGASIGHPIFLRNVTPVFAAIPTTFGPKIRMPRVLMTAATPNIPFVPLQDAIPPVNREIRLTKRY